MRQSTLPRNKDCNKTDGRAPPMVSSSLSYSTSRQEYIHQRKENDSSYGEESDCATRRQPDGDFVMRDGWCSPSSWDVARGGKPRFDPFMEDDEQMLHPIQSYHSSTLGNAYMKQMLGVLLMLCCIVISIQMYIVTQNTVDISSKESINEIDNRVSLQGTLEQLDILPEGNINATKNGKLQSQEVQKTCRRQCQKRINKIYYAGSVAGLNDRQTIIYRLAELAGYLCAQVVIPPPRVLLSVAHNYNMPVSSTIQWTDLYNITFLPDNAPVIRSDIFDDEFDSWLENPVFNMEDTEYEDWLHVISDNDKMIDDFKKVQDFTWSLPLNSNKGFVWEITNNFLGYDLWQQDIPVLPAALRNTSTGQDYRPEMSPYLYNNKNQIASGCEYTDADTKPLKLKQMQKRFKKRIERHSLANSIHGLLHLRRTDTLDICDSSLERISNYLSCSFNGTESRGRNFTLLLTTDEQDTIYRNGVLDMARDYPHVSILDADNMVKKVVNEAVTNGIIQEGLDNNYFIFDVENMLRNTKWGDKDFVKFFMVFRKSRCHDCIPLDKWLAKKLDDYR